MRNRNSLWIVILIALAPAVAPASRQQCRDLFAVGLSRSFVRAEADRSVERILRNVSPADAKPGVIVAAEQRENPPYYYHWVRDAGLAAQALVSAYNRSEDPSERNLLRQRLQEYSRFSEFIQTQPTKTDLGEPKFNVDGTAYNDPWGRRQNDGPAIRASSFIQLYRALDRDGLLTPSERLRLYKTELPARSVIKRDLEYVSHHWREPCFDLWEEVKGDHFYTRMVQRRAMIEGADLADQVGDFGAAKWYRLQARDIERDMLSFWDVDKGYFVATKNRLEGVSYKNSGLDIAVILALLHGSTGDGFLAFDDAKVVATLEKIETAFAALYPINRSPDAPGVAIGRYPEDRYSGDGFSGGNPWPLATLAMAEAYYRMAEAKLKKGEAGLANTLMLKGDRFVARVKYHTGADGSLYEQINRDSGYMVSAKDLTWNYAALFTATAARQRLSRIETPR